MNWPILFPVILPTLSPTTYASFTTKKYVIKIVTLVTIAILQNTYQIINIHFLLKKLLNSIHKCISKVIKTYKVNYITTTNRSEFNRLCKFRKVNKSSEKF